MSKLPVIAKSSWCRDAPYVVLHFLLVSLIKDMVVDLRGGDDTERAERIQWVRGYLKTSFFLKPIHRSDGGVYTTITMHKSSNCTVQMLI